MTPAQEAEREILNALLFTDRAFYFAHTVEGLRPEHFEHPRYRLLFQAMVDVDDASGGFDSVAVASRAAELGLRDAASFTREFSATPPRPADARRYAQVIRDAHLERCLDAVSRSLTARDLDPRARLDEHLGKLMDLAELGSTKQARRADQVVGPYIEEAVAIDEFRDITGVPSGFTAIDAKTGGWQPGRVYVVAARPGMGKSGFLTQVAEHAASAGHPTYYANLEMGEDEIAERLVSLLSGVAASRMMKGGLREGEIRKMLAAGQTIDGVPLYLDDTADLSVMELRAKARRQKARHGLDLLIVDYLQLMRADGGENRVQEVSRMTRGIKLLAKELHVPLIVACQLNRSLETRGATLESKHPQLSDLRESGSIEQDADCVMALFREGYYDADSPRAHLTDVAILKQRRGPTVDWPSEDRPGISLPWDGPTMGLAKG